MSEDLPSSRFGAGHTYGGDDGATVPPSPAGPAAPGPDPGHTNYPPPGYSAPGYATPDYSAPGYGPNTYPPTNYPPAPDLSQQPPIPGGWQQPTPYQPQGFPAPGYGGPTRRPPTWVWAAVALGLVAVIVGVVLLVTVGGKSDEDKVRAAVTSVFQAYNDEDYDAWKDHFCSRADLPSEDDWLDYRDDDGLVEIEITSVRITDDGEARANIRVTPEDDPDDRDTARFELEERDGEWLICFE